MRMIKDEGANQKKRVRLPVLILSEERKLIGMNQD